MIDDQQHLEEITGRKVEKRERQCSMCQGIGGNGWEPTCGNCAGEGVTLEWVYADCAHSVEPTYYSENECADEDCPAWLAAEEARLEKAVAKTEHLPAESAQEMKRRVA